MRVVVDDVRVLGKWLRCWRPAAVTMVFAHASSLRSMAVLLRKPRYSSMVVGLTNAPLYVCGVALKRFPRLVMEGEGGEGPGGGGVGAAG